LTAASVIMSAIVDESVDCSIGVICEFPIWPVSLAVDSVHGCAPCKISGLMRTLLPHLAEYQLPVNPAHDVGKRHRLGRNLLAAAGLAARGRAFGEQPVCLTEHAVGGTR